jgi:hypothetical protein
MKYNIRNATKIKIKSENGGALPRVFKSGHCAVFCGGERFWLGGLKMRCHGSEPGWAYSKYETRNQ